METLPELNSSPMSLKKWDHLLKPLRNLSLGSELQLLNVTQLTDRRKDGHISLYYLHAGGPAPVHRQDCSHWCLPGVPDTWNELLYAHFLRWKPMIHKNTTSSPARNENLID